MARVLAFSCTHAPFMLEGYDKFLARIYKKFKCDTVVCLGDECDFHAIAEVSSGHVTDPEATGVNEEFQAALKQLRKLYRLFPEAKVCISNHTSRPYRNAAKAKVPKQILRDYGEWLQAPSRWRWKDHWIIDEVLYIHGEGYGGRNAFLKAATDNRMSTVLGHCHSIAGCQFLASRLDRIFGLSVGCGFDSKKYAFNYTKTHRNKPVVGCGVVLGKDGIGRDAFFIPMELGRKAVKIF